MELVHFRSVSFCGFHIVDDIVVVVVVINVINVLVVVAVVDRVWPVFFSAS